jgi:CRP/FNR family transcriptional regulator, cyclic AMP receptor protein
VTRIALLDADPDLAETVDPAQLGRARSVLVAPTLEVPGGPWEPAEPLEAAVGLLIVKGALLREAVASDVVSMELLGPGDVIVPLAESSPGAFVEAEVRWSALMPSQLAIVSPSIVQLLSEWPSVLAVLMQRMAERSARQAVVQAICHNPRVEARLRGVLWHLADRWGRVTPAGVVLPLRLTHEALAHLVGAQRPTVSTALKALHDAGEITRRRDGAWVLLPESQERLEQLQRRVTTLPTLAMVQDGDSRSRTLHEQIERLQVAWEQQSASMMVLHKRMAELRAETHELTNGVRRYRESGPDEPASPP